MQTDFGEHQLKNTAEQIIKFNEQYIGSTRGL